MFTDLGNYPDSMTVAEVKAAKEAADLAEQARRRLRREMKAAREAQEDKKVAARFGFGEDTEKMWELYYELQDLVEYR